MAANPGASMAAAIRAWKTVKRMNSPKDYSAFAEPASLGRQHKDAAVKASVFIGTSLDGLIAEPTAISTSSRRAVANRMATMSSCRVVTMGRASAPIPSFFSSGCKSRPGKRRSAG